MKYPLLPLAEVEKFVPLADQLDVSKIARGKTNKTGFLDVLRRHGRNLPPEWVAKRDSFIARTLAAYEKKPTVRRLLSLIMWAFIPK